MTARPKGGPFSFEPAARRCNAERGLGASPAEAPKLAGKFSACRLSPVTRRPFPALIGLPSVLRPRIAGRTRTRPAPHAARQVRLTRQEHPMKEKNSAARCAVIVGPQGTGKTTLLAAMIARAGAAAPAFDTAPESREFRTTTEPNFARADYLGDKWSFIDCPGSVELFEAGAEAMAAADVVVLVADPHPDRAASLAAHLKFLDDRGVPHVIFVNRLDETETRVRDLLETLQAQSARPLVLRQAPIREGGKIVGAVDLVSERAWKYREGTASELIALPDSARAREKEAREALLDTLADFDDGLMEQILEDKTPPSEEVFRLMAKEFEQDLIVPVVLGSASHGFGVTRLLKLLRHEAPAVSQAAERLKLHGGSTVAGVIRTIYAPHAGKISVARVFRGALKDGATIDGSRVSGMLALNGEARAKIDLAEEGDIVGIPRIDALDIGDRIVDGVVEKRRVEGGPALFSLAIRAKNEKDDVKLSSALAKLIEEDRALSTERHADTGETVLKGRGDVHLRMALAKLKGRYNVEASTAPPKAFYRETIKGSVDHHARHKKQSGGHGQFADIKVKIKPLARGEGFRFDEIIHGGSVPRQFIPAVEAGVKEALAEGPLGFPVVDLAVTLYDGQFHSVDSNEMSFKMAGRQAIREALPGCQPTLLEPIYHVTVHTPSAHTSKVHGVLSSRRGQILGFDAREGWLNWDSVSAMLPEPGLHDLIIELRSITQGAATYDAKFDHYTELSGRDAEKIVADRRREASA
jgi:elongation factor G